MLIDNVPILSNRRHHNVEKEGHSCMHCMHGSQVIMNFSWIQSPSRSPLVVRNCAIWLHGEGQQQEHAQKNVISRERCVLAKSLSSKRHGWTLRKNDCRTKTCITLVNRLPCVLLGTTAWKHVANEGHSPAQIVSLIARGMFLDENARRIFFPWSPM
jgi:hypothetical protein